MLTNKPPRLLIKILKKIKATYWSRGIPEKLPSGHQTSFGRAMDVYMKSRLHIDVHWTSNRRLIPTGLDSGCMIWTLLLWTPGSIGSGHWDSGRLDAWLLDAWTLGLWATGHLDTGHLDFGRLKFRRWDSVRLDA